MVPHMPVDQAWQPWPTEPPNLDAQVEISEDPEESLLGRQLVSELEDNQIYRRRSHRGCRGGKKARNGCSSLQCVSLVCISDHNHVEAQAAPAESSELDPEDQQAHCQRTRRGCRGGRKHKYGWAQW